MNITELNINELEKKMPKNKHNHILDYEKYIHADQIHLNSAEEWEEEEEENINMVSPTTACLGVNGRTAGR